MRKLVFIIISVFAFVSCSKNNVTEDELHTYVKEEKNGLTKIFEEGEFKATVKFRPVELMLKQEIENNKEKKIKLDSLRKHYDKCYYFICSFQYNGKDLLTSMTGELHDAALRKLTYELGSSVYAFTDVSNENIKLYDSYFPRMYGVSNSTDVICLFNKEEIGNAKSITISIKDLFKQGQTAEFPFLIKDFENAPKMNFN